MTEQELKHIFDLKVTVFYKLDNSPAGFHNGNFQVMDTQPAIDSFKIHKVLTDASYGLSLDGFQVLDVDSKHVKEQEAFNDYVLDSIEQLQISDKVACYRTKSNGLHILYRYKQTSTKTLKLGYVDDQCVYEILNEQVTMYTDKHEFGLTYKQLFELKKDVTKDVLHNLLSIVDATSERKKTSYTPLPKKKVIKNGSLSPIDRINIGVSIEDAVLDAGFNVNHKKEVKNPSKNSKSLGLTGYLNDDNTFYRYSGQRKKRTNSPYSVYDLIAETHDFNTWREVMDYCKIHLGYVDTY
tara:strand:- start:1222 stop:2109 length:888 start_codon:yes stop_codon:yes gene_type:complete